jgi:hypothetical protein
MRRAAVLALAAALASCSAVQPVPQSPAQAVYAVEGDYAAALAVAVQYRALPQCSASTTALCSRPEVIAQIQKGDAAAWAAIEAAQNTVRTPGVASDAETTALMAAQHATQAFQQIAATLKAN